MKGNAMSANLSPESRTISHATGPYGHGTYAHACHDTTFCADAGGIGDGCGGVNVVTPSDREQRYYDRAVREAAYLDDFGAAEWDV